MVSTTVSPTERFVVLFESSLLCLKNDEEKEKWRTIGRSNLYNIVDKFVSASESVELVLPAFPFKSPNSTAKVTGVLPDAGEELALKKLDKFCRRAQEIYPPGAHVVIFSDGRVFNDLLGVDDATVSAYNAVCQDIVTNNGLKNITFDSLENHVTLEEGDKQRIIEKVMREHMDPKFNIEEALKQEDLQNTYLGFRAFLVLDLGQQWQTPDAAGRTMSKREIDKECKRIAKLMLVRNQAFSSLVAAKYPKCVRISIHGGNTTGPKFSISLINTKPNSRTCASATPWHNVLCQNKDGAVFAVRRQDVDLNRYNLELKDGQPWKYVEKEDGSSSLPLPIFKDGQLIYCTNDYEAAWRHLPVKFEILKPFGLMIRADPSKPAPSLFDIPVESMRELVVGFTTVLIRGFADLTAEEYTEAVRRVGPLVTNPHGYITNVREEGDPKISVFTREAMPFHFDGMFRLKKDTTVDPPKEVSDIPFMQIFQCAIPPSPTDEGGETLFMDTRRVIAAFSTAEKEKMRNTVVGYYMPFSGNYGGTWVYFKIIEPHPLSGEDTLRIHEPWGEVKSERYPILAKAQQEKDEEYVNELFAKFTQMLYDKKYAYIQNWEKNDFLFADNYAQLHTRTAYTTASRHLRRIHIAE